MPKKHNVYRRTENVDDIEPLYCPEQCRKTGTARKSNRCVSSGSDEILAFAQRDCRLHRRRCRQTSNPMLGFIRQKIRLVSRSVETQLRVE
jgi:hypothetical protein